MLVSLSGSFQTTPTFFLDRQNGVQYAMVTQTPQYQIQSLPDLQNIALSGPGMIRPEILANVGSISRTTEPEVVSHYNVRRVIDIYGSVQDRDMGAAGRDITRIVNAFQKFLPRGSFIHIRGQLNTMRADVEGRAGFFPRARRGVTFCALPKTCLAELEGAARELVLRRAMRALPGAVVTRRTAGLVVSRMRFEPEDILEQAVLWS